MKTRFRHVFGIFLGMLLLTTPSAIAQSSEVNAGTITVTATGSASAPADSAMVVITIGPDTNYLPMPVDDGTAPSDTISSLETVIDPAAVIEALVAIGVPVESIEVAEQPFSGEWGPPYGALPVSLIITVDQPDVAQISDMLRVSREAAHLNGWFINQFGVLYQVNDCSAIMREARADAMANATAAAGDQAAAMNLTLGNPVGSRDNANFNMGMPMASCGNDMQTYQTPRIYLAGMFDPTLPAEVTVTITIDVTFSAE